MMASALCLQHVKFQTERLPNGSAPAATPVERDPHAAGRRRRAFSAVRAERVDVDRAVAAAHLVQAQVVQPDAVVEAARRVLVQRPLCGLRSSDSRRAI